MKRTSLTFIEIPPAVWTKVPADRPFSELAKDAMSSERRIKKNVNVGRERARYTQLCDWIELAASNLVREGQLKSTLVWSDTSNAGRVAAYLRLVECLQTHPTLTEALHRKRSFWEWVMGFFRKAKAVEAADNVRQSPLGKSFYPPGRHVEEQVAVFSRITPGRLKELAADLPDNALKEFEALSRAKASFCGAAMRRGSAVVEVLASLPT